MLLTVAWSASVLARARARGSASGEASTAGYSGCVAASPGSECTRADSRLCRMNTAGFGLPSMSSSWMVNT